MGMAPPHCIAFVNRKCANDAKQKKRVRIDRVLNGKQNSAVCGGAAHTSGRLHIARGRGLDTATTNSLGDHLCCHRQSGGTTCSAVNSLGGPLLGGGAVKV